MAQAALGRKAQPTVAGMFFAASPAFHRDLYEAIQRHMQRDYSPTYWFPSSSECNRIRRHMAIPHHVRKMRRSEHNRLAFYKIDCWYNESVFCVV